MKRKSKLFFLLILLFVAAACKTAVQPSAPPGSGAAITVERPEPVFVPGQRGNTSGISDMVVQHGEDYYIAYSVYRNRIAAEEDGLYRLAADGSVSKLITLKDASCLNIAAERIYYIDNGLYYYDLLTGEVKLVFAEVGQKLITIGRDAYYEARYDEIYHIDLLTEEISLLFRGKTMIDIQDGKLFYIQTDDPYIEDGLSIWTYNLDSAEKDKLIGDLSYWARDRVRLTSAGMYYVSNGANYYDFASGEMRKISDMDVYGIYVNEEDDYLLQYVVTDNREAFWWHTALDGSEPRIIDADEAEILGFGYMTGGLRLYNRYNYVGGFPPITGSYAWYIYGEDEPLICRTAEPVTIVQSEQPPELALCYSFKGSEYSVEAARGTTSWHYFLADGLGRSIEADSSHPLAIADSAKLFVADEVRQLQLRFDLEPFSYSVHRWAVVPAPDGYGYTTISEREAVAVYDDCIDISSSETGMVYEVNARWEQGSIWYAFYVGRK